MECRRLGSLTVSFFTSVSLSFDCWTARIGPGQIPAMTSASWGEESVFVELYGGSCLIYTSPGGAPSTNAETAAAWSEGITSGLEVQSSA